MDRARLTGRNDCWTSEDLRQREDGSLSLRLCLHYSIPPPTVPTEVKVQGRDPSDPVRSQLNVRVRAVSHNTASRGHVPEVGTHATGRCSSDRGLKLLMKKTKMIMMMKMTTEMLCQQQCGFMWPFLLIWKKSQDRKCGSAGQEIEVEEALHQGSAEPHLVAMVTNRYG